LILLNAISASSSADGEPLAWADARLTVREGLVAWFDAASLGEAHRANSTVLPPAGAPLDIWFDASGHGRHVTQPIAAARPRWLVLGDHPVVRFDGDDDFLGVTNIHETVENGTLFIVAAPRSNSGAFRAMLAFNELGKNDYVTGLTVDLGGAPSANFETLNLEGLGFGGAVDLFNDVSPFGAFHMLEAVIGTGPGGVTLSVDDKPQASRGRTPGKWRLDDLYLGARYYGNGEPPRVQGFFDGALAEVLIYERLLSDDERLAVRAYLARKYAGMPALEVDRVAGAKPLVPVEHPPAVQVFVPGFEVRELPVDLTNINNVRVRDDGKLIALAYDGNVFLLSDSDADGLEDHAELFWESQGRIQSPIGMALTPPGYAKGNGLFIAGKGKCSLVVDTDGDDRADEEITFADGWQPLAMTHGVDALGVAIDKDQNVYFGLGTADYTNAYQLDRDGKPHYDLASERGTIVKVAPDFAHREIIATGIRFPVALAFNAEGELFCTDQEGATWLANGNPFDELLHIERGRHYGFPPRHPRHLPRVIDEPSLCDYGPQHQSTCGLAFDEPLGGGYVFGPEWWRGDALICGYSRGKLWRTKLARTPAGYVARTDLIASLAMLTADACVTPRGDLVVAVHSGGPDWGSGPNGKGKLYQVHYVDRDAPQPITAWAAGPQEVRVGFDRPLAVEQLADLAGKVSITFGKFARAGDRFESFRPGYEVVQRQALAPRFDLAVLAVSVSADRRTLILSTAPQAEAVGYAIEIDGLRRENPDTSRNLSQLPQVDLGYDLTGAEVTWQASAGDMVWTGWLPHFDPEVAKTITNGSAEHAVLWPLLKQQGRLTMRAKLNVLNMLRPAVQPGSRLDDELPPEEVTLVLRGAAAFEVKTPEGRFAVKETDADGTHEITLPPGEELLPIEIALATPSAEPLLEVNYRTDADDRLRPLPPTRILLPWASTKADDSASPSRSMPAELAGGDWLRGRNAFYGEKAQCAKCHAIGGAGGRSGPNLSNVRHRDYTSVLRDIAQPSFAINPDFVAYGITLQDGRRLTGTVRNDGPMMRIADSQGDEMLLDRDEVEEMMPLAISTMPQDLPKAIGPGAMRDLLTFLLLAAPEGLEPAEIRRPGAPPPRTRAEVEAVLADSKPVTDQPARPLQVVLVAGEKDHGLNEHDYPDWQRRWAKLLPLSEGVKVTTADSWPTADDLTSADVLIFYSANPAWSPEKAQDLDRFQARGGGLVFLHYAVNGQRAPDQLAERIGLAWQGGRSRFRHGALDLEFAADRKHPITRNFRSAHFEDESYWELLGDPARVNVLASGMEEGQPRPLLWTYERGKGRVFCSILGHYSWTFDDPLFRILLLRAIAWTAREDVDRFNELATIGARIAEP
jgi:putative heme-binding domain-containing protein